MKAPWFTSTGNYCGVVFFSRLGDLLPINGLTGYHVPEPGKGGLLGPQLISLAVLSLIVFGSFHLSRRGRIAENWTVAGLLGTYFVFYAAGNPQLFAWYYVPYLWAGTMAMGIGAWALNEAAWRALPGGREPQTGQRPSGGKGTWPRSSLRHWRC
jgi:hypothetical protein